MAQKRAILEYAKKNNYIVSDDLVFIDDGISGRVAKNRPAFMEMILKAKSIPRPFDIILVHKYDRFARNREDSVVYKSLLRKDLGIKVVSITEYLEDDKFSIILESMLEAMAEYYSLNLSEEVKKGLFEKARRGEHIGKAPFGYKIENGNLVIISEEAVIIESIFNLFVCKNYSMQKIVSYLNHNLIKTKKGLCWTVPSIKYILENPVYSGNTRYNYKPSNKNTSAHDIILAKGNHTKIISLETFVKSQEKMKRLSRHNVHLSKELKSFLQHICICKNCGGIMTISTTNGGNYKLFRCSNNNRGLCPVNKTMSVKKLENLIYTQITKDFNAPSPLVLNPLPKNSNYLVILNTQLKKLNNKLNLAKNAYLSQIYTLEEYRVLKNSIELELSSTIEKINKSTLENNNEIIIIDAFYHLLNEDAFTIEQKNSITKSFIKEIQVDLLNKEALIVY